MGFFYTLGKPFRALKNKSLSFLHNNYLKEKLNSIIFGSDTPAGKLFDIILFVSILLSVAIIILESMHFFPESMRTVLRVLELIFTAVFTFEYLARIYCMDKPRTYILSFWGIIDLLATLPSYLGIFFEGAQALLAIRIFRLLRIFRIFKLFAFLNEGNLLLQSLKESSRKIVIFFLFAVILVVSIGTVMYIVESGRNPNGFEDIPNSIYWAIVTMTTVGYGDIAPCTTLGRFLSAIIMLIGYTVLAVPTGIFSVSLINEDKKRRLKICPHCHEHTQNDETKFCSHCGKKFDTSDSAELHTENNEFR
ncbi:MAG: ion transporter [Bacteroidales bacterium]|nr:ion transporter [Bacteroidales bacterium]